MLTKARCITVINCNSLCKKIFAPSYGQENYCIIDVGNHCFLQSLFFFHLEKSSSWAHLGGACGGRQVQKYTVIGALTGLVLETFFNLKMDMS